MESYGINHFVSLTRVWFPCDHCAPQPDWTEEYVESLFASAGKHGERYNGLLPASESNDIAPRTHRPL